MGTRPGLGQWLSEWCRLVCSGCKGSCSCLCELCPQNPDRLRVEEVSAQDYMEEKKKVAKTYISQDNMTKAFLRSFGGFLTGLLLTAIYAYIVLFVKNFQLTFCIWSTYLVGAFLSLGMAFSVQVRATVFLMLPQVLSGKGKAIMLVIAFSLALQGPAANTMENFRRVSDTVSCGIELGINQTKELLDKIRQPLLRAMDFLKSVGRKLYSVSESAKKFFKSMIDGVKHLGRSLRTIWAFLSNMGEVCNEEMEAPYTKCIRIFDKGKEQCFKSLSILGFLCYIVDVFRPLCGLAKTVTLLCALPSYLQTFVRKYIKNPMVTALRNTKEMFQFNLTVIHEFDVTINSSKSVMQVATDIMKEIRDNTKPYIEVLSLFTYSMVFICAYTFIMAMLYRWRYLHQDNYDNIYITRNFIELDVMRMRSNLKTLLPLSSREAYNYIRPGSFTLTRREKKGYMFDIINVFRSLLIVLCLVLMDYVVFWFMDMAAYLLKADVVAEAPMLLDVSVSGSSFISEIFSGVVDAFKVLQNTNITVFSEKCVLRPSPPDLNMYVLIGVMYGLAFLIAAFGIYIQRLQRFICTYYYPSREQERIVFLYNKLLTRRVGIITALTRSIKMNAEDMGHTNILLVLAAKCPCFRSIAELLGANQQYCMACAKACTSTNSQEFLPCITNNCKGLYCCECFQIMDQICIICMAPLAYEENEDEEMDSSDEEQIHLLRDAMRRVKDHEEARREKMKKVLKARVLELCRSWKGSDHLLQQFEQYMRVRDTGEESLGMSEAEASNESGDTDFAEQSDYSGISEEEDWPQQRGLKRTTIHRGRKITDEETGL